MRETRAWDGDTHNGRARHITQTTSSDLAHLDLFPMIPSLAERCSRSGRTGKRIRVCGRGPRRRRPARTTKYPLPGMRMPDNGNRGHAPIRCVPRMKLPAPTVPHSAHRGARSVVPRTLETPPPRRSGIGESARASNGSATGDRRAGSSARGGLCQRGLCSPRLSCRLLRGLLRAAPLEGMRKPQSPRGE